MDLVHEQHGAGTARIQPAAGDLHDFADARHALGHRAERLEHPLRCTSHQPCDRGLAAAGRTPENDGAGRSPFDRFAQRAAGREQVLLSHHLVQRDGTYPGGERLLVGPGEERGFSGHQ